MLRFLGVGKNRSLILSSILLVIISFFYFFVVGSAVDTKIYSFHYRVTYEKNFLTHILTQKLDTFIALSAAVAWFYFSIKSTYVKVPIMICFSTFLLLVLVNYSILSVVVVGLTLPVIISLIAIDRFTHKKILACDLRLTIDYISVITIILTTLGIVGLILFVVNGGTAPAAEKYPYALYQELLSVLTPIVMAALVFCIPLKIILSRFFNKMKLVRNTFLLNIVGERLTTRRTIIYLSLCILLSITVALIPHIAIINPNHERLGVDTPRYVLWLDLMKNQTASPLFKEIYSGDRPLTLIILFLISEATNLDSFQVAEYSPLLLSPLLVLVTFLLTRRITSNDKISVLAASLSAVSFQTLTGIYSGFYANWIALILGYLAFALLVRQLKAPSKFTLILLAVTMSAVLLAHVYTWTIVIVVASIFLFVLLILKQYPRKSILVLYLILSTSLAVDVLKSAWTGSSVGLEADLSVGIIHGFGISQFNERLTTLADTVQTYYGGAYANIAILGLVLYWLVRCKARELVNIFLLIFLSIALVPLFLGDYVLQSRVLYNIPFQIPAAISLNAIWRENHKLLFIAILMVTGYLSFHVLANLGYVPPSSGRVLIQR